jgi:hypothetical protein
MSSFDDHRWPVCAVNMATGAARSFARAHHAFHVAWVLSMCLFTFITWTTGLPVAGFTAWEVVFALYWAAVWGWADQGISG